MTYAKILGTGSYLPEKILTNYDLEKIVATTHQWIMERTGIEQRHIAADNETAVTMAENAAKAAIAAAEMIATNIDMIIVSTSTPENIYPSTACLLQHRLGIKNSPAFDLNSAACSGFVYALSIADQYIRHGTVKNVLIVASEISSRLLDWTDRSTCVLFGDGAGAVILGPSKEPGILSTHIHADGAYQEVLKVAFSPQQPSHILPVKMQGNQLFKLAVTILDKLFDETLAANRIDQSAIDWLIPHQANLRIIQALAKKLGLPLERVALTLAEQANTSSASIPLALDKVIRNKQVKRGQLLLIEGFGGGLTWGSALVKY